MSEHLKFEVRDRIATITLDRPEKLNAFTDEMLDVWLTALETCRCDDEIRVIIVTGTGRAFTTGGDTATFSSSASQTVSDVRARVINGVQRLQRKFAEIEKPIIAMLNGLAIGGGLDIALGCDIRFAGRSARFAETYVSLGLVPGAGGAYLLPRLVGLGKALEMLWTGDFISAEDAERIGLVNHCIDDDKLVEETYAFARRLAEKPPISVQVIKRLVYGGLGKDLTTGLELAALNLPYARLSSDHAEALAAAKEKRQPVFNGR